MTVVNISACARKRSVFSLNTLSPSFSCLGFCGSGDLLSANKKVGGLIGPQLPPPYMEVSMGKKLKPSLPPILSAKWYVNVSIGERLFVKALKMGRKTEKVLYKCNHFTFFKYSNILGREKRFWNKFSPFFYPPS